MVKHTEVRKVGKPEPNPDRLGDIIFVHGLNEDLYETWSNGSENGFWPGWLAEDCPNLDVWYVGYQVATRGGRGAAMPLVFRADNILAALETLGLGAKPMCFITHSMGGLLVKQMLRRAELNEGFKKFCKLTCGVVFLATPHTGSGLANLAEYFKIFSFSKAVQELTEYNTPLVDLNDWYRGNVKRLRIKTLAFYENAPMKKGPFEIIVVDRASADPGITGVLLIGVDADHISICRFPSKNHYIYGMIKNFVLKSLTLPSRPRSSRRSRSTAAPKKEDRNPPKIEDIRNKLYLEICELDDAQWENLLKSQGIEEKSLPDSNRPAKARSLIDRSERWLPQLEQAVKGQIERKAREEAEKKQAMLTQLSQETVSPSNYREVLQIGQTILNTDPDNPLARSQTALAYEEHAIAMNQLGLRQDAIKALDHALELDTQAEFYAWRGLFYAFEDDFEQALSDCNRAIELDPQCARCYYHRASVYGRKGDYDQAIDDITRSIELDPLGIHYYFRCLIYRKKGDSSHALIDIKQAIELASFHFDLNLEKYYKLALELDPQDVSFYKGRGILFGQSQKYDKAIDDFTQAIKLDPKCADCYAFRGTSYYHKEDYDQAISDYTNAVELDPQQANSYWWRAVSYEQKGQDAQAASDYTHAAELDPEQTSSNHRELGESYNSRKDYDRAVAHFTQAIQLDPQRALNYFWRGLSYCKKGDRDRWIADLMHAIELNPQIPTNYYYQAFLKNLQKENFNQWIADLTRAIELQPKNGAFYYLRGLAYKNESDQLYARFDLQQALRLRFTAAKEELDSL